MKYQQIDIRKKIIIPIIVISLIGIMLTLVLTLYLMENQFDAALNKELQQARHAVRQEFEQAAHHLIPETVILSTDVAIREAVLNGDREALARELLPAKVTFGVDAIKVLTKTGDTLISLGPEVPYHKFLVAAGFDLERVTLFVRDNTNIWLTAVAPIRLQDGRIVGLILVGNQIDDGFLQGIKEKIGGEVAIEYDNLFAGSSPATVDHALKYSLKKDELEAFAENSHAYENNHIVHRFEVKTSGSNRATAYALISTLDNAKAKRTNTIIILLINSAMLLALLIAAYLVGRNIAKPLSLMSGRARMIATGDYKQRIQYSGIREIDELATSFNIMSEALEENRAKLEEKVYTDSLTSLYNHRYFHDTLASEISRVYRYLHPLSLILLDIDDFKKVNDTFGHKKGDVALRLLADKMKSSVRDTDIPCRIGGEEFAIVLPETNSYDAFAVAERLRLDIASEHIDEIGRITISLGVATFPDHAIDKDKLIEAADTAMYKAKRKGKNLTLIYDGEELYDVAGEDDKWVVEEAYYIDTLHALAAAVDAKDQYTHSHSEHVAAFAGLIGHELALSSGQIEHLRIAGLLHDVGKIGIPDYILKKEGSLTEAEFQEIRLHPIFGERILMRTKLEPVLKAILYHHERLDGSGYPYGLKEEEIPLNARILAVADSFEAMISDRPYRAGLSVQEAIKELQKDSGTKLDPAVVDALIRIVERDESVRNIIAKRNGKKQSKPAST